MFDFFKKKDAMSGLNQAIEAAKMFGFDVFAWCEKNIPEWAAKARDMENEVGSKLMVSLDLNSTGEYFVLCIWKCNEAGNLDHYLSYELRDIKALLELIKTDLKNDGKENIAHIGTPGTPAATEPAAGTAGDPQPGAGAGTTGTEPADYSGLGSITKQ